MRVGRAEFETAQQNSISSEMIVYGILRGGFISVNDGLFYFCGAVSSVGLQKEETNDTLKLTKGEIK